jgi:hypothetical protein
MNAVINASTVKTKEVKGLEVMKVKNLKTKTNITIRTDDDIKKEVDFFSAVLEDVKALKVEGQPISEISITVEGVPAIGRIINRSIPAFGKIDLEVSELGWDDAAGMVMITGDLTGSEFPSLVETLFRLVERAMGKVGGTQHPLTLYDLKQATGIVYEAKNGEEIATEILDWFSVRELVHLEEVKAAKKAAAEERKAKKKAELKAEAKAMKEEAPTPKPRRKASKSKNQKTAPKTKTGEAASLGSLS